MSPETAFAPAAGFAVTSAPAPSATAFAPAAFPSLVASADRVDENARARGHAAGYLAGLRAAAEENARTEAVRLAEAESRAAEQAQRMSLAVQALDAAIRALHAQAGPALGDVQSAIGTAAVDIAEALVGAQLCDAAESARAAMTRALAGIDVATVVEVRMNTDDLAALPAAERPAGVVFVADPSLGHGDAMTRFPDGFLDARIATAVSRVRAAIAEQPGGGAS